MLAHLSADEGAMNFGRLLLEIGNGQIPVVAEPDTIAISPGLGKVVAKLEDLKTEVYPSVPTHSVSSEWLAEWVILSPLNSNVNQLNNWLIKKLPTDETSYKSVDSAV